MNKKNYSLLLCITLFSSTLYPCWGKRKKNLKGKEFLYNKTYKLGKEQAANRSKSIEYELFTLKIYAGKNKEQTDTIEKGLGYGLILGNIQYVASVIAVGLISSSAIHYLKNH